MIDDVSWAFSINLDFWYKTHYFAHCRYYYILYLTFFAAIEDHSHFHISPWDDDYSNPDYLYEECV